MMVVIVFVCVSVRVCVCQMQWVGWMDGIKDFEVDSSMRFSDIIVPTMDTVRGHFLLELLITNFKQVKDFTNY